LPLVKKHYRTGDVLFMLGDYFDNRQAINIEVGNLGLEVAEMFSDLFPDGVFMICGNHDLYSKSTTKINSIKYFRHIKNIHVFEEPEVVKVGDKKFQMLPWRKHHEDEKAFLKDHAADFLCCHMNVLNMSLNSYTKVERGCDDNDFKGFGHVFSGHIHYTQKSEKVTMLGCPYQLTRSDRNNKKYVLLFDPANSERVEFENNFSPKHLMFDFSSLLHKTPKQIGRLFENHFVDVVVDPKMMMKVPMGVFADEIPRTYRRLEPHLTVEENRLNENAELSSSPIGIERLIEIYVSSLEYDRQMKDRMVGDLKELYKNALAQEQNENKLS
jgi:DNA repair exonuclease SbcCD nuclease subunit